MENYIVAALSASLPDRYEQCIVAKEGDVIISTHQKVFGPDSKEACEKWQADNCSGTTPPKDLKFIVAALTVSAEAKYEQCMIAGENDAIPATHSKVFGPESRSECEKWMTENCGKPLTAKSPGDQSGSAAGTASPSGGGSSSGGSSFSSENGGTGNGAANRDPRYFWLTILQYLLITLVAAVFVFIIYKGMSDITRLNNPDIARGLITFLVAVSTVAIATLATLTAMVLREYKERFAMAKEVLALMIGVLGTIIGFYFGQAKDNPREAQPSPTPIVSAQPSPNQSSASTASSDFGSLNSSGGGN